MSQNQLPKKKNRTEVDGITPHCSGVFEYSKVILDTQFNLQQVNIASFCCKHLIFSEQLILGDGRTKYSLAACLQ